MSHWLQQFITLLPDGSAYLALITLVSFLEALPLIGLLMPGSTLIVLAGFLVAHGKGHLLQLFFFSALGAFTGDFLSFWLGGRLGQRILTMPWLRNQNSKLLEAKIFLNENGGKSLFYARFLGPIRGTIPFLAGISRMSSAFFCKATFINALLWGIAYPGLGYLGGESWQQARHLSSRLGLLVLLTLGVWLFHSWIKRKSK